MSLSLQTSIVTSASSSLDASTQEIVETLLRQWGAKLARNRVRRVYYDAHNMLQDLGISIPPKLRNLNAVLGWPSKAVDVLGDRIKFEGFVAPDVESDPFGLDGLVADNAFGLELDQAVTSALIHSCAFVTVTQGLNGEPDVLWLTRSAEQATGLWDSRRRVLSAGLSVIGWDDLNQPNQFAVYLPDKTIILTKAGTQKWSYGVLPNRTGRVLMEPLRFKPELGRPFGHSRISRPVMSLTNSAIRTVVRSEVGAEFFTSPQRWAMGVDEDAFDRDKWSVVLGQIWAMTKDEDGDAPTVGQFSQASMQPHTDQLRMWASLMAGETAVPMDELGFPSDNPSSDSAIQSQRDPLRLIAERADRSFGSALRRLAITSVMLRDGLDEVSDELRGLQVRWAPAFRISEAAAADMILKQVQTLPWLADSPVILEKLGYDQPTIMRLLSDKRRQEAGSVLSQLVSGGSGDDSGGREPAVGGAEQGDGTGEAGSSTLVQQSAPEQAGGSA